MKHLRANTWHGVSKYMSCLYFESSSLDSLWGLNHLRPDLSEDGQLESNLHTSTLWPLHTDVILLSACMFGISPGVRMGHKMYGSLHYMTMYIEPA